MSLLSYVGCPGLSFRLILDQYLSQTGVSSEDMSLLDQRLLPLVGLLESR